MPATRRLVPLLLVTLCLAGCGDDAEPRTGQVAVALVASATDGSTYRLTPGSRLEAREGRFFESFDLDADASSLRFDLPVGDYDLRLTHPYGFDTDWPLLRTDPDGTETNVFGVLITPQPVQLAIGAGQTSSLVLTFEVAASGTVTFARGSLDVSAQVDRVEATGAHVTYVVNSPVSIARSTVHPAAPAELAGFWPVTGTIDAGAILFGAIGKWTLRSTSRVCTSMELSAPTVSGDASFSALVQESYAAPPAEVDLCIHSDGPAQVLEIQLVRLGPAAGEPFSSLGQLELLFVTRFAAQLPEPVFDGANLDLGRLDWTHGNLPMTGALEVYEVTPAETVPWYEAALEGIVHFAHTPNTL